MSTVSGALNSIATLFSYDIVKRWRPETSDRQLVLIGRVTTFVAMIAAIMWSPFIARFESIYQGITALICYIAPPITAVFLGGVFWRRASGRAAQATLYLGSALGAVVFLLDWFKVSWWTMPSMMTTFYLFVICFVILVTVSAFRPHQHTEVSESLVWKDPLSALRSRLEGVGRLPDPGRIAVFGDGGAVRRFCVKTTDCGSRSDGNAEDAESAEDLTLATVSVPHTGSEWRERSNDLSLPPRSSASSAFLHFPISHCGHSVTRFRSHSRKARIRLVSSVGSSSRRNGSRSAGVRNEKARLALSS